MWLLRERNHEKGKPCPVYPNIMNIILSALSTKNGLLYCDDVIIELPEADKVARKFGFLYVERLVEVLQEKQECSKCADPDHFPRHFGSKLCESGSIASGGKNAHCTCDTCF